MPPRRAGSPLQALGIDSSVPLSRCQTSPVTTNSYPKGTRFNPSRRGRSAACGVQDGALGDRGRQMLGRREGDRRGVSRVAKAREAVVQMPGPRADALAEAANQHVREEGPGELPRIEPAAPAKGNHADVPRR